MFPLKQSTAIDVFFFAFDGNGEPVTGKVTGDWTKRISKNSGAFGSMTVTITELENGWYKAALDTGHTDTNGLLSLSFLIANEVKQVNLQFRVQVRLSDDLAFPTVSGRSLNVSAAGHADAVIQSIVADAITAASIATDAIGAAELAASAVAEIVAGVWDELTATGRVAGSFGQLLKDDINATISSRASAAALATVQSDTDDIQTRLPATLVSGRMDSSVGAMAADTLTASALAADAVTEIQSGLATAAAIATVQSDTDNIQTRLPAALSGGRMDSSIGATQAGAIDLVGFAADTNTYQAKVVLIDDDAGIKDRYVVGWFKNGQPVTSGVTVPTIRIKKISDGTDLVATAAMTDINDGDSRYDEGTNRIVSGAAYQAIATATIDSATRTWKQPIGRDSTV